MYDRQKFGNHIDAPCTRSGEHYITIVWIGQRKRCLCAVLSARWKFTDVETKWKETEIYTSNWHWYGKRKHIAVFLTVRVRTWGRCIISRSVRQQFFLLCCMHVSHLQLTETGRRCLGISWAEVNFNSTLLINLILSIKLQWINSMHH